MKDRKDRIKETMTQEKKTKIKRGISIFLEAWAVMTSLTCLMSVAPAVSDQGQRVSVWGRIAEAYTADVMRTTLLLIVLLCFFARWSQKKAAEKLPFRLSIAIAAFLFGFNIVLGESFLEYENLTLLIADWFEFLLMVVVIAGYMALFYVILYHLFLKVQEKEAASQESLADSSLQPHPAFWSRHFGIFSFAVMMICYLPYLIAFYPGSINSDTLHQMCMYFGYVEFTNHYPVFSTWIIGSCMQLGKMFGSDNLGAFFYGLLQTCALSAAFAATLQVMKKWGISRKIRLGFLAFYALTPFFGGYAQFLIKDTLYSAGVLAFVTVLAEALKEQETFFNRKRGIILFVVLGILIALLRNNGIYVALPGALALILGNRTRKGKQYGACGFAAVFLLYFCWSSLVLPALGIPAGSVKEALSIPFQQTARYVKEYGEEVTPKERASINKVLDYDSLAEVYTTYGSDPVKNTYKEPAPGEKSQLGQYFATWFEMFRKHPKVYFEATISNSYYYYSGSIHTTLEPVFLTEITQNEHTGFFTLKQPDSHTKMRNAISAFSNLVQKTPVLGILYSEGLYTYLLIGMAAYCFFRRRYRLLPVLLPSAFCILICIASPINGSFRYFLPVIVQTPVLLAFLSEKKSQRQ